MKKGIITPQVINLYNALRSRDIKCEMEVWDGHKHVDISITWAMIDIEVDGLYHYTKPEQIRADFNRSYWSITRDDYDTLHIPNIIIDHHLEEVANAIASVARTRYEEIKEESKSIWSKLKKMFIK